MTAVLASPQLDFSPTIDEDSTLLTEIGGAQSLLEFYREPTSYFGQTAAVILYALALGALCYFAKPHSVPQDQPIELTMVPDDTPAAPLVPEQTPPDTPPVADQPPPEQTAETPPQVQEPPPPFDQQEAVAPVAPPPPPPPPVTHVEVKHKPKPQAVASRAATARHSSTASGANSAPNALPSSYANLVHAQIARAAADTYPEAAELNHLTARVSYHVVIGPSGELISKSITPSGNPMFDQAANVALERAAPFPSTGFSRPVSLYGAIAYRLN